MNVIGQIDPSAFAAAQRLHHVQDESTLEFPSSASSRRRNLIAQKCQNWRASGGAPTPPWDYAVEYVRIVKGQIPVSLTIDDVLTIDANYTTTTDIGSDHATITVYGQGCGLYRGSTIWIMYGRGSMPAPAESDVVRSVHWMDSDARPRGSAYVNGQVKINGYSYPYTGQPVTTSITGGNIGGIFFRQVSIARDGADIVRLVPCVKEGVATFYDEVGGAFVNPVMSSGGYTIAGPRI